MGGRGASSGLSERGNPYGSQYHTVLEHENIKFVTNSIKNYEPLNQRDKDFLDKVSRIWHNRSR